MAGAKLLKYL